MAITPPLTQLFGSGASQSETELTISKAALPDLTATDSNSSQGLAVALLARWAIGQDQSNDAIFTVRIQPPAIAQRGTTTRTLHRYIVDIYAPYNGPSQPNPDDF